MLPLSRERAISRRIVKRDPKSGCELIENFNGLFLPPTSFTFPSSLSSELYRARARTKRATRLLIIINRCDGASATDETSGWVNNQL